MQKIWKRLLCLCALAHGLEALPKSAEVLSGEVCILEVDTGIMRVEASNRSIINYKDFSIGSGERVEFIQPSKDSTVLNRVIGSDPSNILGQMTSSGKVFLVNPNGIYFGSESVVNTGSLIVSTLDILDQDFLEGKYSFRLKGKNLSLIHNEGFLNASEGVIALISPSIKNEGLIKASLEKVVLLSGESITLSFDAQGLMSFEILDDAQDALIEHIGSTEARQVFLQVGAAKKAVDAVINTEGLIAADTLVKENGRVRIAKQSHIKADSAFIEGADVLVRGEIDVSSASCKGGTLHILGDTLEIAGATIDTRGSLGGGTVLIGGEYKGGEGIRTALNTNIDEYTIIQANALQEGDGGRIIVWAEDTTFFGGTIFAQGGETSGNGGFVETSGKENLYIGTSSKVNTLSPRGKPGSWLLDPTNLTIDAAGAATLPLTCADATNPTISTATINAATTNVILCATSTITQNAGANIAITTTGVSLSFVGTGGTITTTLNAGVATTAGAIQFTTTSVVLGSGASVLIDTTNAGAAAPGADISFDSTGTINGTAATEVLTLNAGTSGIISFGASVGATTALASLVFTNSSLISIGSTIRLSGSSLTFGQPVLLTGASTITSTGASLNTTFSSTLDGTQTLSVTGGTGAIIFNGAIGSSAPLSTLSATASPGAGTVTQNSTAMVNGSLAYNGASGISLKGDVTTKGGTITFTGAVTLTNNLTIDSTNAGGVAAGNTISFSSVTTPVNGASFLTVTSGTSNTTFTGAIGNSVALTGLTVTGATVTQSSTSNIAGPLTYTGTSISINNNMTTQGFPITLNGPITGSNNFSFSSAGGTATTGANITFNGTFNIASNITISAGTAGIFTMNGSVGASVTIATWVVTAWMINHSSTIRTQNQITLNGSGGVFLGGNISAFGNNASSTITITTNTGVKTTLGNNITLDTTNGGVSPGRNISLNTVIDGPYSLILSAGTVGTVAMSRIGASSPPTSLSVTGGTLSINGVVTTTGSASFIAATSANMGNSAGVFTNGGTITFTGPATIGTNVSIDATNAGAAPAGANISFSSTVTSFSAPQIKAGTGTVTFSGAISGATAWIVSGGTITQGSTAVATSGISYTATTINLNGSATTSGGFIAMTGNVVIGANLNIDTTNSGGSTAGSFLTISGTLDGAFTLSLLGGTGGNITIGGAIGGSTPLTSLSVTGRTISQVSTVKTTGAVSYTGILGITLGGGITTTNSAIGFTGPVTFTAASSIDTTNGLGTGGTGANITFSSTVDGALDLAFSSGTSGNIIFSGAVGSAAPPTNLTFTSSAGIQVGSNITVSGANTLNFAQAVTLTGASTIETTNANVFFTSTINGANTLTFIAGSGTITFSSSIGATTPPTNLVFTSGALAQVGGDITVSGANPLVFTLPLSLTGSGSRTITSTSANITFQSTIISSVSGTTGLSVAGGSGITIFNAQVGSTPLASLSVTAAEIDVKASIATSGGAITMTGPVFLSNSPTFDTTISSAAGATITFTSTLDAIDFVEAPTFNSGTSGDVVFSGVVGGNLAPANLIFGTVHAISIGDNVTVSGSNTLNLSSPVLFTAAGTITTNNANLSFGFTLNGAFNITLVAGTGTVAFTGQVGNSAPPTQLSFTSASLIQIGSSIAVSGANPLTFPFPVSLTGISTITSNDAAVGFSNILNGAQDLSIAAGSGSVTFSAFVGNTTPLTSLSVTSGVLNQSKTVDVTGAVTYTNSALATISGVITASSFTQNGTGSVSLGASITTASTIQFATAVSLTASVTLTGPSGITSVSNMIPTSDRTYDLTLSAIAGTVAVADIGSASNYISTLTVIAQTLSSSVIYADTVTLNIQTIGGSLIAPGADLTVTSAVTVSTGTFTIDVTGGSSAGGVTFDSTLDGPGNLIFVVGTGDLEFDGDIGGITAFGDMTVTSAANVNVLENFTGSSFTQTAGSDTTNIVGAMTTSSSSGISITGTTLNITGALTTTGSGPVVLNNGGILTLSGGISANGSVSQTGAGAVSLEGSILTTNATAISAAVSFASAVTMTDAISINAIAGNGNISFGSTLNGAYILTLAAGTGTITYTGAVGGTTPPVNLSMTSAGLIQIGNNITVSGAHALIFPANVSLLGSSTILSNNANVVFGGTLISSVSGASALVVQAGTGTLDFVGTIGSTPLASLNATASTITQESSVTAVGVISYTGSTAINIQGDVTTSGGAISMIGPTFLTNSPTFDSTNGSVTGGTILFTETLDGADASEVASFESGTTHNVVFTGAVGGITPLANLLFGSVQTIEVGANITVTGTNALPFTSPVSLFGASTITSNNADITFSDAIDGAEVLVIAGGIGTVTFDAAVGGTTPPISLAVTGGSIEVSADITTNGGFITLTGATLLSNSPTFDTTNAGGVPTGANISFGGTLNGSDASQSPILQAGSLGNVIFGGAVGGVTPLVDVTYNSAEIIEIGSSYRLTGASPIAFPFPTQITGISTISSVNNTAAVSFSSTLDGPGTLTINTSGSTSAVTFSGAVGGTTPLATLSVIGSTITQSSSVRSVGALTYTGSSLLIQGNVATRSGQIQMIGPVTLSNDPLIDSTDNGSSAIGADISFSSTVNGATSLTLAAGSAGTVTFNAAVGGTAALTNLVFNSASLIEIGANVRVSGANPLVFSSAVSLTGNSTINSTSASITFNSTIDGAHALILTGGGGTVTFEDVVGGATPLQSLAVTAATITQEAALVSSGALVYSNIGLLTISGTITAGSLVQTGGGTVLLEASIIALVSIVFNNPITFDTSLLMVVAGPSGVTLNTIEPTLDGVFDLGLSARTGTITATRLGASSAYINVLTLTAKAINVGSIYANTVLQNGAETINSNIVAPGAYLIFPNPTTVASGGPYTIDVSGGSSPGGAWFQSTLDGPGGLDFTIGSGNLRFDGSIGGIVAMSSLTVESAQNVSLYSDFTGGSFTQVAGAGTTVIAGTMTTTTSSGISLTGTNFNITGPLITQSAGTITIDNTGLLTLTGSVTSNGIFSQIGSGDVYLGNAITATNAVTASSGTSFIGPITLVDDVTINTSTGGGDITFASTATVDGLENFSLIAGSGNITADGVIGSITPLEALSIYSADDIDLVAITAASFKQVDGTGTTTFAGDVTTIGDAGIVLSGSAFDVNALLQTYGKGSITVQNSGAFTLNTGGQIKAAGSFIQMGSGSTDLHGNIISDE